MTPVAVNDPVVGLYNSAVALQFPEDWQPPVINTIPLFSSVAVWPQRLESMLPVAV